MFITISNIELSLKYTIYYNVVDMIKFLLNISLLLLVVHRMFEKQIITRHGY